MMANRTTAVVPGMFTEMADTSLFHKGSSYPSTAMHTSKEEQRQFGLMTVNFKMNVVTSGPHDGLFIATGLQANSCGNNGNGNGITWWRGMDQLALLQQAQKHKNQNQALLSSPMNALNEDFLNGKSALPFAGEANNECSRLGEQRVVFPSTGDFDGINPAHTGTVCAPASLPRLNKGRNLFGTDAPVEDEYSCSRVGTMASAKPIERQSSPPPVFPRNTVLGRLYGSPTQSGEDLARGVVTAVDKEQAGGITTSIPIHVESPGQCTIRLNTFENNGGLEAGDAAKRPLMGFTTNPSSSNPTSQPRVPQHDYVLNDTTTTTTTVEVFRAEPDAFSPADYYKLPPDPFSLGYEPRFVKADGAPYEVLQSTETRFSGRPRVEHGSLAQTPATSAISPPQGYYITEPASTPMRSSSLGRPITWGPVEVEDLDQRSSVNMIREENSMPQTDEPTSFDSSWAAAISPEEERVPLPRPSSRSTTILRRQINERRERVVSPASREEDSGLLAAEGPSTKLGSQQDLRREYSTEPVRTCPPLPPKPPHPYLRRGISQPDLPMHYRGLSRARTTPPRPATKKPRLRGQRSRSTEWSAPEDGEEKERRPQFLQTEQLQRYLQNVSDISPYDEDRRPQSAAGYPPPAAHHHQMGARSASVSEIYRLYQTRDCLGRIVQQFLTEHIVQSLCKHNYELLASGEEDRGDEVIDSGSPILLATQPVASPTKPMGESNAEQCSEADTGKEVEDVSLFAYIDDMSSCAMAERMSLSSNSSPTTSFASNMSPSSELELHSRFTQELNGGGLSGVGDTPLPDMVMTAVVNAEFADDDSNDGASVKELKEKIAKISTSLQLMTTKFSSSMGNPPQLSTLHEANEELVQDGLLSETNPVPEKGIAVETWQSLHPFAIGCVNPEPGSWMTLRANELDPYTLVDEVLGGNTLRSELRPPLIKDSNRLLLQKTAKSWRMSQKAGVSRSGLLFEELKNEPRKLGAYGNRQQWLEPSLTLEAVDTRQRGKEEEEKEKDTISPPAVRLIVDGYKLHVIEPLQSSL